MQQAPRHSASKLLLHRDEESRWTVTRPTSCTCHSEFGPGSVGQPAGSLLLLSLLFVTSGLVMSCTAAKLLKAREAELPGTVVLLFQPAEEGPGGAAVMISDVPKPLIALLNTVVRPRSCGETPLWHVRDAHDVSRIAPSHARTARLCGRLQLPASRRPASRLMLVACRGGCA